MGKKRNSASIREFPTSWTKHETMKINGRILEKGSEFSVKGQRGRFRFIAHVVTDKTEWIDCIGGQKGYEVFRSFNPDQVRRVHVKQTMRLNARIKE